MIDYGLSTQQLQVVYALSSGANMATAAEQAGVHPNTITNWRRNLLPFQHALADAQYDRALYFREKSEDRIDAVYKSFDELLADPKTPAGVRLRAILSIIQIANTPPLPKKQVELDIEKVILKRSEPNTITEEQLAPAPPVPAEAQAEARPAKNPEIIHKESQPTPPEIGINPSSSAAGASPTPEPVTRANPKVGRPIPGRNAACPCGSGKKFKRCCVNHPRFASAS